MSRTERISRYNDMMAVLRQNDIAQWRKSYLQDLQALKPRSEQESEEKKVVSFTRLA